MLRSSYRDDIFKDSELLTAQNSSNDLEGHSRSLEITWLDGEHTVL